MLVYSLLCYLLLLFSVALRQGEDLVRESGIPYTIVRPCALTEEPAGADLIFDQGDNITVCIVYIVQKSIMVL